MGRMPRRPAAGHCQTSPRRCDPSSAVSQAQEVCARPCTLLEHSLGMPDFEGFFLAATLLEALSEHFSLQPLPLSLDVFVPDEDTVSTPVTQGSIWQHLSLRVRLHPWSPQDHPFLAGVDASEPLQVGPLSLGVTVGQLVAFMQPAVALDPLGPVLCSLPQGDVTFLSQRSSRTIDFESRELHCFTDGSFYPATETGRSRQTWACFFVCPLSGAVGALSGSTPDCISGAQEIASAYGAECCALTAAIWLGMTVFHQRPLVIRSDCQAAIGVITGTHSAAPTGPAAVLSAIAGLSRAKGATHLTSRIFLATKATLAMTSRISLRSMLPRDAVPAKGRGGSARNRYGGLMAALSCGGVALRTKPWRGMSPCHPRVSATCRCAAPASVSMTPI